MRTSVASLTLRSLPVEEVAALARRAGLDAVEWSQAHVAPGDTQTAVRAAEACKKYGLAVSAYGSNYRHDAGADFSPFLETARVLGAPTIRIWAGRKGSADCPEDERQALSRGFAQDLAQAAAHGFALATEYHANTLTDTAASAVRLLDDVPGLTTYWQPPVGAAPEENLGAIRLLSGRIANVHVYSRDDAGEKKPLCYRAERWKACFDALSGLDDRHFATMEFVMGDRAEQFLADAAVLVRLLDECAKGRC